VDVEPNAGVEVPVEVGDILTLDGVVNAWFATVACGLAAVAGLYLGFHRR
jgi:hypothetical protein